jgi:hypothetical protein
MSLQHALRLVDFRLFADRTLLLALLVLHVALRALLTCTVLKHPVIDSLYFYSGCCWVVCCQILRIAND